MMVYVDTNVIIARYMEEDELKQSADALLGRRGLDLLGSPLTVVELASVLSRVRVRLRGRRKRATIPSLVRYILLDSGVRIETPLAVVRSKLLGGYVPLEYHLSLAYAERLRLKSLDLIHVAYASALGADVLATGDREILDRREEIVEEAGVDVKHPSELIRGA